MADGDRAAEGQPGSGAPPAEAPAEAPPSEAAPGEGQGALQPAPQEGLPLRSQEPTGFELLNAATALLDTIQFRLGQVGQYRVPGDVRAVYADLERIQLLSERLDKTYGGQAGYLTVTQRALALRAQIGVILEDHDVAARLVGVPALEATLAQTREQAERDLAGKDAEAAALRGDYEQHLAALATEKRGLVARLSDDGLPLEAEGRGYVPEAELGRRGYIPVSDAENYARVTLGMVGGEAYRDMQKRGDDLARNVERLERSNTRLKGQVERARAAATQKAAGKVPARRRG